MRHAVDVVRLDDCLPSWIGDSDAVDVMKVDIEGYEPYLIQGVSARSARVASNASRSRRAVTGWPCGELPDLLLRQLKALGFRHLDTPNRKTENETVLMEHA